MATCVRFCNGRSSCVLPLQTLFTLDLYAEAGWKVLQKGFTGFKESKLKMKDFDRQESGESEDAAEPPTVPLLEEDAVEGW
jgi:hypothetical protein